MKNELELIADFLNSASDEGSFLYEIDEIEAANLPKKIGNKPVTWTYRTIKMMNMNFVEACKWRKLRNLTNNCMIVGETGEGKTNPVIALRDYLMDLYNLENHYLVMGNYLDMRIRRVIKDYGRNSIIIVEEAQEAINRLRKMSNKNMNFANTLDAIRKHNIHFIFVTPTWSRIDTDIVESALHWLFICTKNDHNKQVVRTRLEYNCKDVGQESHGMYLLHSLIEFNWADLEEFNGYDQLVFNAVDELERSYHEEVSSYNKTQKKDHKDEVATQLQEFVNIHVKKMKLVMSKRDDLTIKKKTKLVGLLEDYIVSNNFDYASTNRASLLRVNPSTYNRMRNSWLTSKTKRQTKEKE